MFALALAMMLDAHAQDEVTGFDAHGFVLPVQVGDGRDLMGLPRPARLEPMGFFATGAFEYVDRPLTLLRQYPDETGLDDELVTVLDNVMAIDLALGFAPVSFLRIDVAAPIFLTSKGIDPLDDGNMVSQGAGFGDIRLSALANLLAPKEDGKGFGLGLQPFLDLPTGNDAEFLGAPGLSGGGRVIASLEAGGLTATGGVGFQANKKIELSNLSNADALLFNVGVGYLFTDLIGATAEVRWNSALPKAGVPGTGTPLETIVSVHGGTEGGAHWLGGVGFGMNNGAGAPALRIFLGGGLGRPNGEVAAPVSNTDTDGDGITGAKDQCPEQAEKVNGYKDDDGCPDKLGKTMVSALVDEQITAGVDLTITGPSGTKTVTTDYGAVMIDLIPGMYTVTGKSGDSTADETVEIVQGNNAIVADLMPGTPSQVKAIVVDANNKPVPGAHVTLRGARAKDTEWTTGPDGSTSFEHKAGKFTIYGHVNDTSSIAQQAIVLKPGESSTWTLKLGQAVVKVEKAQISTFEPVYFAFNDSTIESRSYALLDQVAAVLQTQVKKGTVVIAGHTDNVGGQDFNLALSQRRAEAVLEYLASKGVSRSRLAAKGYGPSKPIATNDTEEGRAKNRRVEFQIFPE